jgi:hypothetical protein
LYLAADPFLLSQLSTKYPQKTLKDALWMAMLSGPVQEKTVGIGRKKRDITVSGHRRVI